MIRDLDPANPPVLQKTAVEIDLERLAKIVAAQITHFDPAKSGQD